MTFKILRQRHLRAQAHDGCDESGQGLAEYALILGLVAAVCVGALSGLGGALAGSAGFVNLPGAM